MGLPFLLLFGGGGPAEARVTRVARTVLGESSETPEARVTRIARTVLGTGAIPEARVTRIVRTVLGPPRGATFRNAELTIGITWIELTRPSDTA